MIFILHRERFRRYDLNEGRGGEQRLRVEKGGRG
jgi:hypothetical protein